MAGRVIAALLRVLLGGGFVYLGVLKLQDPAFLYGGLIHEIRALGDPFPLYEQYFLRPVEFRQEFFAYAVAIGAIGVGASLLLGAFVSLGATAGAVLILNFALATAWGNFPMMAVHLCLAALLILLGRGRAGLTWGLDGVLVNHIHERVVLFPLRTSIPASPVRFVPQHAPPARRSAPRAGQR